MRTLSMVLVLSAACVTVSSQARAEEPAGAPPAPPPAAADATPEAPPGEGVDSLEKLLQVQVSSVSRHAERVSDAPATVSVITAEEIRKQGYRSIGEALRTIPGVFVHYDRAYEFVGIRGFGLLGDYSTRTLILLDGHPLNSQLAIGASYVGDDAPVDLAEVERIEVIKGPASATYGATAFFGVINIVTKKGADLQGGSTEARIGSFLRRDVSGVAGRRYENGIEASASARYLNEIGPDLTFPEQGGTTFGADYEQSVVAHGRVAWGGFTAAFDGVNRSKGVPTAPFGTTFGSDFNRYVNQQEFFTLGYSHDFGSVDVSATGSWDQYQFEDYLDYSPAAPHWRDRGLETWQGLAIQLGWQATPTTRFQVGADGSSHVARTASFEVDTPDAAVGLHKTFTTGTVYAQVEQRFFDEKLRLVAGATGYKHSLFDSRVTPKAGLVWIPDSKNTLKILYGEGFRPPTLFEAFFDDGVTIQSNASLRPEHGRTVEGAYERVLGGRARVTAAVHHDFYENLINEFTVDISPGVSRLEYQNKGRIESFGTEESLQVDLGEGWFARAGYAWQRATEVLDGVVTRELTNFPSNEVNVAVVGDLITDRLSLGVNGSYLTDRKRDPTTDELAADPNRVHRVPAYVLIDATLRYRTPDALGVQFSIYNALDRANQDPAVADHLPVTAVTQDGLTFLCSADYRF